jgi:cytidine deaminase
VRDPGPRQDRIVLVGLSGVGKSALAARLRETLTQTRGECRVLKLADPLYRIQRLYYEIACVEATGQDQALLATVATQLRALSPRALLDDFLDRLRQVPPDVAVVNDDLRDPDVDAVGLRAEGFLFVRVTCPEQVRRARLAGRADISQIDELEWFGADLDRMEVDGTVDTSVHSVEECVQQVLRIAAEHLRPDGDAAHTVEDEEPMHLAHDQARVLVVGPWAWRFGRGPAPGDQYGVIRLPLGGAAVNTTLLRFAELVDAPYAALEWQGPVLVTGTLSRAPFADLRPAGELATTDRARREQ